MAFNLKLFESVHFLCPKCAKNTEVKTADLYSFKCQCATPERPPCNHEWAQDLNGNMVCVRCGQGMK